MDGEISRGRGREQGEEDGRGEWLTDTLCTCYSSQQLKRISGDRLTHNHVTRVQATETSVTCTLACYAKIQAPSFRSPEVLFFVFCRTVETSPGYIILPTFHFALDNTKDVDRTNVDSKTSVALNRAYKCRVLFLYHYNFSFTFFIFFFYIA